MKLLETRHRLIDSTIQVIAQEGLDGATTKLIGGRADTNEVYIYRCFVDKEDLFAKTFQSLDEELLERAMFHIPVMYMQEIPYEERCRLFFSAIWNFLLSSKEKCLTYIRYYYSPYFQRCSAGDHRRRYVPLVEKFRPAFNEDANVWMLMNHLLTTMLDFAVRVFDGGLSDSEETAEHVFRLVYYSMGPYFQNSRGEDVAT